MCHLSPFKFAATAPPLSSYAREKKTLRVKFDNLNDLLDSAKSIRSILLPSQTLLVQFIANFAPTRPRRIFFNKSNMSADARDVSKYEKWADLAEAMQEDAVTLQVAEGSISVAAKPLVPENDSGAE